MRPRPQAELPADVEQLLRSAARLEWWTLFFLATIVAAMYLAMGSSQAMKTAWVEDMLSMVAPAAFLVAARIRRRPPDAQHPYGFERVLEIAFLVAAVALTGVGAFLIYDGAMALIRAERPSIGIVQLFGRELWMGWVMVAALVYSVIPPVVLGRRKLKLARELSLKSLYTDADTNKADWMTGAAGIAGILGIGLGWWWADAVAALAIALSVLKDGIGNLVHAVGDLIDRVPQVVDRSQQDPLVGRVRSRVEALDWVGSAGVRLRDEGMMLVGEVFVVPANGAVVGLRQLQEAREAALDTHWRMLEVVVTAEAGQEPA